MPTVDEAVIIQIKRMIFAVSETPFQKLDKVDETGQPGQNWIK